MNIEIEPAPVDLEHKLVSDNQHLQQTVGALRDRLEGLRLEKDGAVQRAVAAMAGELEQLKATTNTLRDNLERERFNSQEAVQKAVAAANAENVQIRESVGA